MNKRKVISIVLIVIMVIVASVIIFTIFSRRNNGYDDYIKDVDPTAQVALDDYAKITDEAIDIYTVYNYDMSNSYELKSKDDWECGAATAALSHWNCDEVLKEGHMESFYIVVFKSADITYSAVVNDVFTEVKLISGDVLN